MDSERAIGRLEAAVDGLQTSLGELKTDVKSEMAEVKEDLKTLLAWRWKLYGANAVISAIAAFIVSLVFAIIKHT